MVCESCGFANAEGVRFCGGCGVRLDETALPGGRERKVVSVLFCDLVGFTEASDAADPEDVQAALSPYHARARLDIERFGGTVEKFIGDAVMAVFGAPAVHEDDAERAVRAGLRLLDTVEELNEEHGLALSVRIGVATGEAVVSTQARVQHGEGMVAGDVVNTAARLQTAAPPGGVLVGESTWRATRAAIEYKELPPVSVKGKAEPVQVWLATDTRSRVGEAVADTSTVLIGRQYELDLLRHTFARASRERTLQLVTIVGEPGVGKSRLVQEFADWVEELEELVTWRQGRCLSYGEGITFWPLSQIVKSQAGILDTDPPEHVLAELSETVTLLLEAVGSPTTTAPWLVSRLQPLVGLAGGDTQQEELFAAWQRFIELIASTGPAVLVLEDLHWAEPALLAFCEHLLKWVSGVPLLLICTARPELFDHATGWGGGQRNTTTIGLNPLSPDETALLITGLLGTTTLPAATHQLLLERSGGNPLYAGEFVRMLADRGQASSTADLDATHDQFPGTVQAVIAARLDTLPPTSKELLADAAVIGMTFWSGAVAAVAGQDEGAVRAVMNELSRRDYLRPSRTSVVEGELEYTFAHALIVEVAYAQIPRSDRAAKHAAAARWHIGIAGGDLDDAIYRAAVLDSTAPGVEESGGELAAVIAHHLRQALALSAAAGKQRDRALVDSARRWLMAACNHALPLDLSTSEAHCMAALELTEADDPHLPFVRLNLARAQDRAGDYREAESNLRRAHDEFLRYDDRRAAAAALIRLDYILGELGRAVEAEALLADAIRTLEGEPPGPELLSAYVSKAGALMVQSRFGEGINWANRALELANRLDLVRTAHAAAAVGFRGVCRGWSDDLAGARDDISQSINLARLLNRGSLECSMLINIGNLEAAQDPARGMAHYEQAREVALARGARDDALFVGGQQALLLVELGRWDEALNFATELLGSPGEPDQTRARGIVHQALAKVFAERGDTEAAEHHLAPILTLARNSEEPSLFIPTLVLAVGCALARDDRRDAEVLTAELTKFLVPDLDGIAAQDLAALARVLLSAGRDDIVRRIAAQPSGGIPLVDNHIATAAAMLAERDGDLEQAVVQYESVAMAWRTYGNVNEEAKALLCGGRCRARLGENDAARRSLTAAQDTFERLGAEPAARETQQLLGSLHPT